MATLERMTTAVSDMTYWHGLQTDCQVAWCQLTAIVVTVGAGSTALGGRGAGVAQS